MKRISSRMVFFHKRIFPLIWFGVVGLFFLGMLLARIRGKGDVVPLPLLVAPVIMAVVGVVVMRKLIFGLADEVFDAGDHLVVRNGGMEDRIPFSSMRNISFQSMVNPPRVTISLREASRFGKEIAFMPLARVGEFFYGSNPIVEGLIERMERANGR